MSLVVSNKDPRYLNWRQSPYLLVMLMMCSSVVEGFIWRFLSSSSVGVGALISAIFLGQFTSIQLIIAEV